MKKIISMFLSVCCLVSFVALVACEKEEKTKNNGASASVENSMVISSDADMTGSASGSLQFTDMKVGKKVCKHSYNAWKTTKKATCSREGKKVRTCKKCKYKQTKSIKKTAHSYNNWVITKKASCKAEGSKYRVCKNCKYKQTKKINKTAHNCGDWKVTKKATCKTAGSRYAACKNKNCKYKYTEKIPKLSHTYGAWKITKKATCKATGSKYRVCKKCKYKQTVKIKVTHKYGAWKVTKKATTKAKGEKKRTCSVCKATQKKSIPKVKKLDYVKEIWDTEGHPCKIFYYTDGSTKREDSCIYCNTYDCKYKDTKKCPKYERDKDPAYYTKYCIRCRKPKCDFTEDAKIKSGKYCPGYSWIDDAWFCEHPEKFKDLYDWF